MRKSDPDNCSLCGGGSELQFEQPAIFCQVCSNRIKRNSTYYTNPNKKYHVRDAVESSDGLDGCVRCIAVGHTRCVLASCTAVLSMPCERVSLPVLAACVHACMALLGCMFELARVRMPTSRLWLLFALPH